MAVLDFQYQLLDNPAYCSQLAYDGTYIWVVTHSNTNAKKLWRLRHSDKELIKPDGTVGTTADAYVDLTSATAKPCSLVTDGTTLMVGTHEYIQRFDCATMTKIANVGSTINTIGYGCEQARYDGTHFWFTSMFPADVLHQITAAGTATAVNSGIGRNSVVEIGGGNIWVLPGQTNQSAVLIYKLAADGTGSTSIASNLSTITSQTLRCFYDTDRDEVQISGGSNFESLRIRASDGAFLDSVGAVVASATAARISIATHPYECWQAGTTGVHVVDGQVITGGVADTLASYGMQRRSVVTGKGSGLWYRSLPHGVMDFLVVGTTIYGSLGGIQYFAQSGLMWAEYTDATSARLTAVDPGTGPHISLTFDNPVGITGPTIGGPSDGLGVTGVTAISATQIDLACAIRPDHPDGDADNATLIPPIGEADPLGPPVPTGVGATVI